MEALQQICRTLPVDLPAGVVVVLHVARQKPSLLPGILARESALPVAHAKDGEPIRTGRIYVAPPDHHLLVDSDSLRLSRSATEHYTRPAIDPTLRSAAHSHRGRVIGVILTGALGDGAMGLLTVKRAGGLAIVQDPDDAMYPQMPEAAIQNVPVDLVLPLSQIGECLSRLAGQTVDGEEPPVSAEDDPMEATRLLVEREQQAQISNDRTGQPAIFTCPECGGSLWQADEKMVHFRCHVGHTYAGGDLLDHQSNATEGRLWEVLRYLVDQSILGKQLAARAEKDGRARGADHFYKRAAVADQHAAVIRQLIQNTSFTDSTDDQSRKSA